MSRNSAIALAGSLWTQLAGNRAALAAYRLQVAADDTSLTGTERQQQVGDRTVLDVLNAQHALLQAQVKVAELQHDEIVAEYTLAGTLGEGTAKALILPVEYYDPNRHLLEVRDKWFGFGKPE